MVETDLNVVIVDYGMGNLNSILNMFKKIGVSALISNKISDLTYAQRMILPGVGAFDHGIASLQNSGLLPILNQRVLSDRVPVLGICLGMQLMTRGSEEGIKPGLGWVAAQTRRFTTDQVAPIKVPHMGWNSARLEQSSALFEGLETENRFYFVHSYYVECDSDSSCLATTTHGIEFTSAMRHDNIFGVQFHPEKSHKFGMTILRNFSRLKLDQ